MALLHRLRNMLRQRDVEQQIEDELGFHRDLALQKALKAGLSPEEARRQVSKRMGNESLAREGMRDARLIPWLESCVQDLHHGFRMLRREPGLSTLLVVGLALGIGGNTAIFTLFKAALLDPLPYPHPDRLVTVLDHFQNLGIDDTSPTIPEFLDIRDRNGVFEQMAFVDHRDFQLTGTDEPVRVFAARSTASLFPMLGVKTSLGRTFLPEENLPGRTNVVLLSDAFWRRQMAADRSIAGKSIRLNGQPHTIIGILEAGFTFDYPTLGVPEPVDIYVPFVMDEYYTQRSGGYSNSRRVRVLARLRDGVDIRQADADLQTIASALAQDYPALYQTPKGQSAGFGVRVQPLQEAVSGKHRPLLLLMLSAVAIVLVIACGNAAQLLLARALRRAREVNVRTALGASRLRLVRQFLLESLVVAACGGMLGLLLAGWMARLLAFRLPFQSPVLNNVQIDSTVLLFTFALSLLSTVASGIVPSLKGSAWPPGTALTSRGSAGTGNRWRHVMIAVEAAFSVVLLFAAGLLCQNLWRVLSASRGFDPGDVTVMQLRLPHVREQALNPSPMNGYREYLEKISAIAGVDSAAVVTGLPVRGRMQARFSIEGVPDNPEARTRQVAMWQRISGDYFRTLRIPLRSGRTFREDDIAGRPGLIIVNQEFVRRFLPGREPIGQRIVIGAPLTIIGVVGDIRISGFQTAPEPQVYVSYLQAYDPNIHLVVRSSLPLAEIQKRVKQAIRSAYADQAVFNVTTMERVVSLSVAEPKFQAFLIGVFALLALTMAASGMYSVISCLVAQRTSEIAIRLALGASRAGLLKSIIGHTTAWVAAGLAAGAGLGLGASSVVRKLSWSAEPANPLIYLLMMLLYLLVTVLACWMPARRALGVDPAVALRAD
jgi:predicted permease